MSDQHHVHYKLKKKQTQNKPKSQNKPNKPQSKLTQYLATVQQQSCIFFSPFFFVFRITT